MFTSIKSNVSDFVGPTQAEWTAVFTAVKTAATKVKDVAVRAWNWITSWTTDSKADLTTVPTAA